MPDIDWKKIKTKEDIAAIDPHLLYDDTRVYSPSELLTLNPNLSDSELEDALFWSRYRRGLLIVSGQPRQGKTNLEHMIAFKMKYYFQMLPILDTRPRTIFGQYIPFSQDMLEEQIERMTLMNDGKGKTLEDGSWTTEAGDIFLRNAVVGMDEFGTKYMYRRDSPNKPIKRELLKVFDYWGHANCLWLGAGISIDDIDRRCLDKIVWEARCNRIYEAEECQLDPNVIIIGVWLAPVKYDAFHDRMEIVGEPEALRINASKPQKCLPLNPITGEHYAWKDIYKTDNAQGFSVERKVRKE